MKIRSVGRQLFVSGFRARGGKGAGEGVSELGLSRSRGREDAADRSGGLGDFGSGLRFPLGRPALARARAARRVRRPRSRSLPASGTSSCSAFKSLLEAPATVFPENQPVFCAARFSVFLATLIATRGTGLFTHRYFPAGWGAPLGQSPCPIRLFSLVVAQSQAHSKRVNSCGRNKRMQ